MRHANMKSLKQKKEGDEEEDERERERARETPPFPRQSRGLAVTRRMQTRTAQWLSSPASHL